MSQLRQKQLFVLGQSSPKRAIVLLGQAPYSKNDFLPSDFGHVVQLAYELFCDRSQFGRRTALFTEKASHLLARLLICHRDFPFEFRNGVGKLVVIDCRNRLVETRKEDLLPEPHKQEHNGHNGRKAKPAAPVSPSQGGRLPLGADEQGTVQIPSVAGQRKPTPAGIGDTCAVPVLVDSLLRCWRLLKVDSNRAIPWVTQTFSFAGDFVVVGPSGGQKPV